MRNVEDFKRMLEAANAAPARAVRSYGCGRAYVAVRGVEKAERRAFMAACKKLNLMFLSKAYGTSGDVIYCGYDNADGRALAKAEAMAASLNEAGLAGCYVDPVAD